MLSINDLVSPPEEFLRLRELAKLLLQMRPDYCEDENFFFGKQKLDTARWGFMPRIGLRKPARIDRRGDVLAGPLFTCAGYEWPLVKGLPTVPLIQLSLDRVCEHTGINVGSGLLQISFGQDDQPCFEPQIRIIPASIVADRKNILLPVPAMQPTRSRMIPDGWMEGDQAMQILGYKPPHFTMQGRGESIVDDRDSPELQKLQAEWDRLMEFTDKHWDAAGLHLFGTYFRVQYAEDETGPPLFCFDCDHDFFWGDTGTAQVFCKTGKDGNFEYSFNWSCY